MRAVELTKITYWFMKERALFLTRNKFYALVDLTTVNLPISQFAREFQTTINCREVIEFTPNPGVDLVHLNYQCGGNFYSSIKCQTVKSLTSLSLQIYQDLSNSIETNHRARDPHNRAIYMCQT